MISNWGEIVFSVITLLGLAAIVCRLIKPKKPADKFTTGVPHGPAAGITFHSVEDLGPQLAHKSRNFQTRLKSQRGHYESRSGMGMQ
jgi:hypothetical protein